MMKILYTSYLCSQQYFQKLFDSAIVKPSQASQKFNHLMAVGLHENGVEITCLSGRPITARSHKKKIWAKIEEEEKGIKYIYMPFFNNSVIKQLAYFLYSFFYTLNWAIKNKKEAAVVTDVLCNPVTIGSSFAARLVKIPVNGIVTDLPNLMNFSDKKRSIKEKVVNFIKINPFSACTHFTLLTIQMNCVVNPHKKPYVIVEGLVDSEMKEVSRIIPSDGKRHICYTGQIYEKFGVKNLVESFMLVKAKNTILDIYGPGPMAKDMPKYMKMDNRIRYHGCVTIQESVHAQLSSYLLVNPRPTHQEFTKYSFPSKNMEYMASGTPVLTTKLPGIPKEYYPYVFLYKGESVESMAETLQEILEMPEAEVNAKGEDGKHFVMTYKNNVAQSKKVLDLIS